jgi:hypothetical protein
LASWKRENFRRIIRRVKNRREQQQQQQQQQQLKLSRVKERERMRERGVRKPIYSVACTFRQLSLSPFSLPATHTHA